MILHTTPWMTVAHGMYERFGFERDPALDWTPVPGIDLLGYRLEPLRGEGADGRRGRVGRDGQ